MDTYIHTLNKNSVGLLLLLLLGQTPAFFFCSNQIRLPRYVAVSYYIIEIRQHQ